MSVKATLNPVLAPLRGGSSGVSETLASPSRSLPSAAFRHRTQQKKCSEKTIFQKQQWQALKNTHTLQHIIDFKCSLEFLWFSKSFFFSLLLAFSNLDVDYTILVYRYMSYNRATEQKINIFSHVLKFYIYLYMYIYMHVAYFRVWCVGVT